MAPPTTAPLMQWRRIEILVHTWLEQRQQLIVRLCALQGLHNLNDHPSRCEPKSVPISVPVRVREFCQLLVDYLCAGHFEVYQALMREARQHRSTPPMASRVLRQLEPSTSEALAFNEDFDSDDHCREKLEQLPARLNRLTEVLEERFTLEDQLILSAHQAPRRYALRR